MTYLLQLCLLGHVSITQYTCYNFVCWVKGVSLIVLLDTPLYSNSSGPNIFFSMANILLVDALPPIVEDAKVKEAIQDEVELDLPLSSFFSYRRSRKLWTGGDNK